jgi:hypothetical protein
MAIGGGHDGKTRLLGSAPEKVTVLRRLNVRPDSPEAILFVDAYAFLGIPYCTSKFLLV